MDNKEKIVKILQNLPNVRKDIKSFNRYKQYFDFLNAIKSFGYKDEINEEIIRILVYQEDKSCDECFSEFINYIFELIRNG